MTAPNLPEPYLTVGSIVDRMTAHIAHLGGNGIDFVTVALLRSLVRDIIRLDPTMLESHLETICETIGVGLPVAQEQYARPLAVARDITETDR